VSAALGIGAQILSRTARVRLAASLRDDGTPRIYVTQGVEDAAARVVNGMPYRAESIVPRGPWRRATEDEERGLVTAEPSRGSGVTIDVVRVSDAFLAPFRALGLDRTPSLEACKAVLRTAAYAQAVADATPELFDLVESPEGLKVLGTCVQHGGLWSTTTHVDADGSESFSGLHVDDWDRLEHGRRRDSRRQMCVNLGSEDRFFVFAPATVDELDVARAHFATGDIYLGVGRALFASSPEARVCKVRVRPGEAYIAPTDNLVHDGTTVGNGAIDVNFSIRGHFGVATPGA
jgi:hypothetical protein